MIAYTNYATDGRVRLEAETSRRWGYSVIVLALKTGPQSRTLDLSGVTVRELNTRKYRGRSNFSYVFSYLSFLALAFVACTKLFMEGRADMVHVHNMPNFLVFAAIIPRLFGRRLVLDMHDTVPETYAAKFETGSKMLFTLLSWEEAICCRLAHKIICVNHVQREAMINRGISGEKIVVVISIHSLSAVASDAAPSGGSGKFRMVWHGTVSRRLGVGLIVQAAAKLVARIPGFELHIFGSGDDMDDLVNLTKSLNIEQQVHFRGQVPWHTLPQELAGMDVGVVGNGRNIATDLMLPIKLIDFVALGIAAVVPKLRTIQYYFSGDMVAFFEPDDAGSMADAVFALYKDPARRRLQPQRARAFLEKYRWDNQGGLHDVYGVVQTQSSSVAMAPERCE